MFDFFYRWRHSLIVSSVAVSGRFAIAKHLDSVDLVDKDVLLVVFSLGMAKFHSIYSNENIYRLKNVNHIQKHTRICQTTEKKNISNNFKVRTMAIFFAVDVGWWWTLLLLPASTLKRRTNGRERKRRRRRKRKKNEPPYIAFSLLYSILSLSFALPSVDFSSSSILHDGECASARARARSCASNYRRQL